MSADLIKAVGSLALSATAKYVAAISLTFRTEAVAALVTLTGLPRSTVYRAQGEFMQQATDEMIRYLNCPTDENPEVLTDGNPECLTDEKTSGKTVSLTGIPSCAPSAGATKELPSEVVIPVVLDSPPSGTPQASTALVVIEPDPVMLTPVDDEPTAKRATRLAADWELPDDWRQWARLSFVHASDEMISLEAEKFRDFWVAKPGRDGRKLDWLATWRNWCRNSKLSAIPSRQPLNYGRMPWDEQRAAKNKSDRDFLVNLGMLTEAVQ